MTEVRKVILVDDEVSVLKALEQTLMIHDFQVEAFGSAEKALDRLDENWDGVVVSDINMPNMDGKTFLQKAMSVDSELAFIMITGHGDVSTAVECMRTGAYDFIEKPFSTDRLIESINRAYENRQLILENRKLKEELHAQSGPGPRILGNSPAIKQLRSSLGRIKNIDASVLITGDTGTGKELAVRFLHDHSARQSAPFVVISCGAMSDDLIDQELFGSADPTKPKGKLAQANNGTLLLDDVESMSEILQQKFLRFLEDRKFQPAGGGEIQSSDVRVIATCKTDLKKQVEAQKFRSDLYYRLNVISLEMPPLRDRKEDVPILFENFLRNICSRYQISVPRLTLNQQAWLQSHDWPGNVRELRNLAERLVLMGDRSVFNSESSNALDVSFTEQVQKFEKTVIHDALEHCSGRLKQVQAQLNIPRKTLYEKMQRYGLDKNQYKE